MAFYAESAAPRDLYVARPGDAARSASSPTRSTRPSIPPTWCQAEVVRFKSYDGVEIPGLLYKPRGASAADKAPALVWVHGGPGGQSRVGYSGLIQYLVNHGYAVYAINNRGSSGYGKTFLRHGRPQARRRRPRRLRGEQEDARRHRLGRRRPASASSAAATAATWCSPR